MRQATSGTTLPYCTYSWLQGAQNIGAGANLSPAAIACPGARVGDLVAVSAKTRLPQTGTGSAPSLQAWVTTDDHVGLVISNQNNAVLVAGSVDIEILMMCFPRTP